MSDIFISYASEDRAKARALAQFLESEGWSTFWDRAIPVGMTWNQFIGKELTETRCLVVLWSQASVDSSWVQEEADEGKRRGILIPVLIEEVLPPFGFRGIQAGDLSDWDGNEATSEFRRLVSHIARVIGVVPREVEEEPRGETEEEKRLEAQEDEQVALEAKRLEEEEAAVRDEKEAGRGEPLAGLSAEHISKAAELANWEFIKDSDSADDFRDHLTRFPDGLVERMARRKLEALVWAGLAKPPTLEALESFLAEFPGGKHASEAQAKRDELQKAAAKARAAEEREQKELAAWEVAKDSGDAEALDAFLRDWPGSRYRSEVRRLKRAAKKQGSRVKPAAREEQPSGGGMPSPAPAKRSTSLFAVLFLLLVLPVQFLLAYLFHQNETFGYLVDSTIWCNYGSDAGVTELEAMSNGLGVGLFLAVALALIGGVRSYRRQHLLSSGTVSTYWLGCVLALLFALPILFANGHLGWTYSGGLILEPAQSSSSSWGCYAAKALGWLATGSILVLVIALVSATVLAFKFRKSLSNADLVRYWLGCALASGPALAFLFTVNRWQVADYDEIELAGLRLAADPGGTLMAGLYFAMWLSLLAAGLICLIVAAMRVASRRAALRNDPERVGDLRPS